MKLHVVATAVAVFVAGCSSSAASSPQGEGAPACTSADGTTCPTGAGALQLCTTSSGSQCAGAYFQIGSQVFNCTSCTDTTSCEDQATAVCYGDAGSGGGNDASSD